jgi:LPXTG-site transpeptidase (sortase) family protein
MIISDYIHQEETITKINNDINKDLSNAKQNNSQAILKIDKIDLEMAIFTSDIYNIQRQLDENKLVSLSEYQKDNYLIFGHYTQEANLLFNRIDELVKDDEIQINYNEEDIIYRIVDTGQVKRAEYDTLLANNTLNLVTCTKDFNDDLYYYIKAIREG